MGHRSWGCKVGHDWATEPCSVVGAQADFVGLTNMLSGRDSSVRRNLLSSLLHLHLVTS